MTASVSSSNKKQIYLAGTFPIGGSEGWQGGQVGAENELFITINLVIFFEGVFAGCKIGS